MPAPFNPTDARSQCDRHAATAQAVSASNCDFVGVAAP